MDTAFIMSFVFVGACVVLATYSAFYMYKFINSYSGKFKRAVQYLFFSVALFTLLVILFGTTGMFGASNTFAIILSVTAIIAFFMLLKCSKSIYNTEREIMIEHLDEKNNFLKTKTKLLQEKFFKRKITEDMFKDLLKDLEREIIDTDARMTVLKEKK